MFVTSERLKVLPTFPPTTFQISVDSGDSCRPYLDLSNFMQFHLRIQGRNG
jgi:hypothetical protein